MAAEKSIIRTLKQMLNNDAIMYYILWKYAPDAIPEEDNIKTYSDLCNKYKALQGRTEQSVEKSLYKEEVQAAIKVLLKRLDGKRDIELLNKYYDLAMGGDVQALKAYIDYEILYSRVQHYSLVGFLWSMRKLSPFPTRRIKKASHRKCDLRICVCAYVRIYVISVCFFA